MSNRLIATSFDGQIYFFKDSSFLKQPRLGGEDLAEDDDDNDDSIGGLGRRIRKLSSRTIEFCDSIDNIQVSHSLLV